MQQPQKMDPRWEPLRQFLLRHRTERLAREAQQSQSNRASEQSKAG